VTRESGGALQLISSGGMYGAERVVIELATHLASRGWRSHVAAIESPGAGAVLAAARAAGLETFELQTTGRSFLATLRSLHQYVDRQDIEVAHAHGYKADLFLRFARVSDRTALFSTCHTWYRENFRMRMYEFLDKRALRHFDHVAVVSPELERDVVRSGVPAARVSLVQNGIAMPVPGANARQRVRAAFGMNAGEALIVRIGRLSAAKGNDILLDAVSRIVRRIRVRLVLIGDGEEQGALRDLSTKLGIAENVIFAGYREDIADILTASEVFVIPSIREGLPIVLLEAMASRVAIVSTDVGAISLALEGGRNAWLVPPGNAERLADALHDALSNADRRIGYAQQAHTDFVARFSRQAMGEAYRERYTKAIEARRFRRKARPVPQF
jgi:glycosyltransferase involved in cell wall biosynthesis